MLFTSLRFAAFFSVVFSGYWLCPNNQLRKLCLVVAGLWFYADWNSFLALVLTASTTIDFLVARRMDSGVDESHRRFLLRLSIFMNCGLLCFFKYLTFLGQNLNAWFGLSIPDLSLPNPVGISFYTFEAISYSVDVFRRKICAEKRLEHLLIFITFFPHVVAGPIVRSRAFLPQIARWKNWNWSRAEWGISYFVLGLFKKLALADRLALIVDPVFSVPSHYSGLTVTAAVLAYSLQIYCDFSGYTDMALGLAHLLGFRLAPNFNRPYASLSVVEFWRRWHISLSSWLRDYLYIPLGGNANGPWRTHLNLWITMLLGGLWHGASWNFVLWGGLHASFLSIQRTFPRRLRLPRPVCWMLTFGAVTLAWIPFRASSFETTVDVCRAILTQPSGSTLPVAWSGFLFSLIVVAGATWISGLPNWGRFYRGLPKPLIGLILAGLALMSFCLSPQRTEPFIYFQF